MTEKQKIFADEYLIDLNATRAYKIAYPKVKKDEVAAAAASRLLKDVKVAAYIDDQLEKMRSERVADAQEVLEYLTSVIRGELTEETVVVEGRGEGISVARIIEKRLQEKDRLKAAELLARRYGILTDKMQVSGSLEAEKSKLDDLINQMRGGSG